MLSARPSHDIRSQDWTQLPTEPSPQTADQRSPALAPTLTSSARSTCSGSPDPRLSHAHAVDPWFRNRTLSSLSSYSMIIAPHMKSRSKSRAATPSWLILEVWLKGSATAVGSPELSISYVSTNPQDAFKSTETCPRVIREYGQISCAASTSSFFTFSSSPEIFTSSRTAN